MNADSEEGKRVQESNTKYLAALEARPVNAGNYVNNESQTLQSLRKTREVQSWASERKDAICQASKWDMEDSFKAVDKVRARYHQRICVCLCVRIPVYCAADILLYLAGACPLTASDP